MDNFELRQGDFGRVIQVRARDVPSGLDTPIPLGSSAVFTMTSKATGRIVTGSAVLSNPPGATTNNLMTYTFVAGDSDEVGCYEVDFVVTYPLGAGQDTFPSCGCGQRRVIVEVCAR